MPCFPRIQGIKTVTFFYRCNMNNSNEHKYWEVYRHGHERNGYYYPSQVNPKMYLNQRSPGLFISVDEKGGLVFI